MPRPVNQNRFLPTNTKAIQKAVKEVAAGARTPGEFRIDGHRGLVLLVLASGTATWYFHYDVRIGRRRDRRKHHIGRLDAVSLGEATLAAERLRSEVRLGADPAAQRVAVRKTITFAELATERLDRGDPLRPGTRHDYALILNKDVLPYIGAMPARSVSREDVICVLDTITRRGATRRADTARAVVSSIFAYGMDRGLVESNPASGLRNRHDYSPRDVVLNHNSLRQLWRALDDQPIPMSPAIRRIIQLALLTGQRRAEIAGLRKEELLLKPQQPTLIISRGRAKNRNQHQVPLSPQAVRIIEAALAEAGDGDFLFPGLDGNAPILPRSVSKAMERTRVLLGINEITVHDLRRTVGSMLTRFGVPKDVRERILNHGGKRKGSITESVYSWYDYDAEKRAALELWADALDAIVSGQTAEIADYNSRLAHLKGGGLLRVA